MRVSGSWWRPTPTDLFFIFMPKAFRARHRTRSPTVTRASWKDCVNDGCGKRDCRRAALGVDWRWRYVDSVRVAASRRIHPRAVGLDWFGRAGLAAAFRRRLGREPGFESAIRFSTILARDVGRGAGGVVRRERVRALARAARADNH